MYKHHCRFVLFVCLVAACAVFSSYAEEDIVYYNPEGGRYYHAEPECKTMRSEYYPLMQPIAVADLAQESYEALERCVYCFQGNTSVKPPSYFCHGDDEPNYATAPDGFLLEKAGEYMAGIDFPSGVYTLHGDGFSQGEARIYAQDGRLLHTFMVSGRETVSFYLAENMRLSLPEGLSLQNMTHVARFQSTREVADITSARYFMLLECPGRKYCVQSKEGLEGSVLIYSMDAELGLTQPQRFALPEGETVIINLSGLYNHFVELHNCLIWAAEEGVG